MTKTVVIYARQSMDQQEGIDRQLERCRALAEARGWTVVEELVDNAVSASKSRDTAEWGRLVEGATEGRWEVVIAAKLDRLARRVRDVLELADIGLQIVTLEGDLDTTTDVGRFQATLLASLAELEVARKGVRQRDANASRAKQGRPVVRKRPYGWRADGVTLEPEEAEHLRTAILSIINGGSINAEARRMTEAGQRTPVYKSGRGGQDITARTLVQYLDRPRMAGINIYQGSETEESVIQPIVDRETWEEYRSIRLDPNRLTHAPGRKPLMHWMTNVATCPCGDTLRSTNAVSRGKKYAYYRCGSGVKRGHVGITATILEDRTTEAVWRELMKRRKEEPETGEVRALRLQRKDLAESILTATEALSEARTEASRSAARKVLHRLEDDYQRADEELTAALRSTDAMNWSAIVDANLATATPEEHAQGITHVLSWEGFLDRWEGMDVEVKRDMTRRLLEVQVLPRDQQDRVVLTPR